MNIALNFIRLKTMPNTLRLSGDRVFRLGGLLDLDGRVSWAPAGARGSQPLSCYLIRGAHGAVLIDTGARLHEEVILDQLDALLPHDADLSVLLTRTEMDCCLNIPAIEARRPVRSVFYTGGITVPRSHAEAQRIAVEDGRPLALQAGADVTLRIFAPRLRLLPTLWPFDAESGVLFTSDSFAHARCGGPAGERFAGLVVRETGREVDPAAIQAQMMTKFSWLGGTDTRPIAADVKAIFEDCDGLGSAVRTLAPTHGLMFQGHEVVDEQRELMVEQIVKAGR
ncbi:hypothetical protein [Streptomyces sp. NPDC056821]|uniref:hypothetical protein n=1 Tax=unclassified Streptomyces TaxID=2593676 RepID=UPI0036C3E808